MSFSIGGPPAPRTILKFCVNKIATVFAEEVDRYLRRLKDDRERNVRTGLADIDKAMNPMRPGQLIPVLGYTNNYKTGLMNIIARNVAQECQENECVVVANWEDSVEDNGIWNLAGMTQISTTAIERGELSAADLLRMERSAVDVAKVPIFWVGHSDIDMRRRGRMTIMDVWAMMERLIDVHKRKPRLLVLDYLQRIKPHSGGGDHRIGMMQIVDVAKDMAIAFGVPVLLGTQAGRSLMSAAPPKLPQMHHAQETSNIEQSASAFLSTCFPAKTMAINEICEVNGRFTL